MANGLGIMAVVMASAGISQHQHGCESVANVMTLCVIMAVSISYQPMKGMYQPMAMTCMANESLSAVMAINDSWQYSHAIAGNDVIQPMTEIFVRTTSAMAYLNK